MTRQPAMMSETGSSVSGQTDRPTGSPKGIPAGSLNPRAKTDSLVKPETIQRRSWLAGAVSLVAFAGCKPDSSGGSDSAGSAGGESRRQVPLRVVWVGSDAEADILRRTWQSISEQPLDLRLVTPPQSAPEGEASKVVEMAAKADVVVYPLMWMAEMIGEKRLMPLLSSSEQDSIGDVVSSDSGNASRRNGMPASLKVATSFAGEQRAIPLGGHLPAMLLSESVAEQDGDASLKTWAAYREFAKQHDGKCAEPTAKGWAAAMYLWRLSTSLDATWLFDRETMRPLLDEPNYVAVLEEMAETVKLNPSLVKSDGLSPGQVYQSIASGELVGGIGFPQLETEQSAGSDAVSAVSILSLPSGTIAISERDDLSLGKVDLRRSMMNPFMLVGSLAASCRQTAAADRFLQWLAGGQGSEPIYRNIGSIVNTQTQAGDDESGTVDGYQAWLRKELSDPNVVPTLQLLGAAEYYRVLDEGVRACVHGDRPAKQVCAEISEAWRKLNLKHDLPTQMRSWRRAQGGA
ncbi:ABC transporter substrate-binding protein [Neorhodopirellula lusitana]|uniref:ABC transporter substrate-binding protein n=1 Tax=Neorhodopirellula lusitana TaxID=445327 RepID=UPI00384AE017